MLKERRKGREEKGLATATFDSGGGTFSAVYVNFRFQGNLVIVLSSREQALGCKPFSFHAWSLSPAATLSTNLQSRPVCLLTMCRDWAGKEFLSLPMNLYTVLVRCGFVFSESVAQPVDIFSNGLHFRRGPAPSPRPSGP